MRYIILVLLLAGCAESAEVNHAANMTVSEQCQVWNKWGTADGSYGKCD